MPMAGSQCSAMVCCTGVPASPVKKSNSSAFASSLSMVSGAPASISSSTICLGNGRSSFTRSTQPPSLRKSFKRELRLVRGVTPRCSSVPGALNVMIAGAPASGKGTQCELISAKFGLTHISAGDLLRAEIAAGTEAGKVAKEYMTAGKLVPTEIVVRMVKERLSMPDARSGWLLDGYPRSLEQAQALEAVGIRPDIFILLDVPDDILVDRIVGRRSDPVTGKIYHLQYSPPEDEEIASRLIQRFDDVEEKVKARVDTHHANVEAVLDVYKDIIKAVDGNRSKLEVFAEISSLLSGVQQKEGSPVL